MKAQFIFLTLWKRDNSSSLAVGKLNPVAVAASFEQRERTNSSAQRLMKQPVQEAEAWRERVAVGEGLLSTSDPPSFVTCSLSAGRG